jgi:glycosyltransferase involved in cell wall biosynthesis
MDKVLTIGIPVFNGAKTIRDTIESVLMQLDDDLKGKVEILISNNHSTDNTKEIVKEYVTLFPDNIHIYDNDRPDLELDGNLINIFKLSKSEFVWIMTDDDAFYPNSINYILELISSRGEDLGLIFVNYAECDEYLNENAVREREDIYVSYFCANGDDFFIKSKMLFGLASSLIFKREAWISAELNKYVGLKSLHIGALVEVLSCNSSYIVSEKLIKLRTGNTTWGQGGTFIFYMLNMVKMLKNTKELNYKKSTYNYLINHFRKENYKSIIRAKLEGFSDNQKLFKETYICYGDKISFWALDIFLIFLPTVFLRFLKNIYLRVQK